MLPVRDNNPSGTIPFVTVGLIFVNIFVYLIEASHKDQELALFLFNFGFVPAKLTYFIKSGDGMIFNGIIPTFSSMFLHGGLAHLVSNMWYLWIFGDNVEYHFGHVKFLLFYILSGFAATFTHFLLEPYASVPAIGASGAISGVLGAYFLCFPKARVLTFLPVPVLRSFRGLISTAEVPGFLFLGFWFVLQLYNSGLFPLIEGPSSSGVAYWAHIGGFVGGMIFLFILPKNKKFKPVMARVKDAT